MGNEESRTLSHEGDTPASAKPYSREREAKRNLLPLPKRNIVFLVLMVSNAESQRARSNAEFVDLFPLRYSADSASPR